MACSRSARMSRLPSIRNVTIELRTSSSQQPEMKQNKEHIEVSTKWLILSRQHFRIIYVQRAIFILIKIDRIFFPTDNNEHCFRYWLYWIISHKKINQTNINKVLWLLSLHMASLGPKEFMQIIITARNSINSLALGVHTCNFKYTIFKYISVIISPGFCCEMSLIWRPWFLIERFNKLTMAQVRAWCHQVTNHYLNLCWIGFRMPYSITRQQ